MVFTSVSEDKVFRFPVNSVIKIIQGNSDDNALFMYCLSMLRIIIIFMFK
ncbi:hypothetical protein SCALIN_C13_0134 [Candidatus Scalindua japonica]|uniref:Uncharacterized protein n=1 Tax=Candidatus Scalindua japonica TaxID=1284222 RepID=A0A286TXS7_9BACT|nr:hypothetical protein SCALIN_C13_0134 [Candidatus Scalindua japonica]